jgi:hypothetical protein
MQMECEWLQQQTHSLSKAASALTCICFLDVLVCILGCKLFQIAEIVNQSHSSTVDMVVYSTRYCSRVSEILTNFKKWGIHFIESYVLETTFNCITETAHSAKTGSNMFAVWPPQYILLCEHIEMRKAWSELMVKMFQFGPLKHTNDTEITWSA